MATQNQPFKITGRSRSNQSYKIGRAPSYSKAKRIASTNQRLGVQGVRIFFGSKELEF